MDRATIDIPETERLLTPNELSRHLGIPTTTLANWRYLRKGPAFVRIGRHVRYRTCDVLEWVITQRQASRA